ncbi:EF-hand domain-containing protein [Rhizobium sp. FY34]|uniref:EF-hand domain-containing protein n=1 Tax=Rhizobium sp. FY34 TaxID=2562309 RepID=UPI0010C014E1|nr:EF-hand domain-containing protein [Rhizobium sp. FY34]
MIKVAVPALVLLASLTMASSGHAQQDAFMSADKNADTMLDQNEFKLFIDSMAASGKPVAVKVKQAKRYGMAFGRIDQDKNGLLTPTELKALQ